MILYYISLGLNYRDYITKDNELRFEFQKKTSFINDYFSKKVRKLKFQTDGTFNMISISVSEFEFNSVNYVPLNVLEVNIEFDRSKYESIKNSLDCSYYLEILEQGFKKASEIKSIPLNELLELIEEFKNDGYKNKWTHKKKHFKNEDLEIILNCEYTSLYFELTISINQISKKKKLLSGVIIRTEVGVSIHEGMYKDIIIQDNHIIITDKTDKSRVLINKLKVYNGVLDFKIMGDEEIVKILSYQM
ncbi:hypothetical protein [Flavobacterium filum]|uniref:hypothetical protein n=1 Tax=Flavobacterium filum TaxID=370974 RepID=UPI0004219B31|nr:hypothetical protein [Flavobacterium filum]